jgi:hypothetical protein
MDRKATTIFLPAILIKGEQANMEDGRYAHPEL